jgi:RimJ/RimL family protein N-acetyltransferase
MARGLEGRLVRLVPLDIERHLDNCVEWFSDPEVTRTLTVGVKPMTRAMERSWFEEMMKGPRHDIVWAIETLEGRHIGQSGLHRIDWRNRTAASGTVIGEREAWGQGYGTDAAIIRARYAFDSLDLAVLFSEFLEGNEGSKRMQEACGYEIWGVKPRAYFRDGRRIDGVQTALTRERFREVHG